MPLDIASLTADTFKPLVGQTFTVTPDGGHPALTLTLQSVKELPEATMRNAPRTAFSLMFDCPGPVGFCDGLVMMVHGTLGEIGPLAMQQVQNTQYGSTAAVFQLQFN